ncbi:hypothetical protein D9Q98_006436 [Chlorella vulgaris]|uniref:Uncharacterized protein n=1 Tax=Chlorella vulgaris TaxID=3077 RepID=A0A9D4YV04_CHLVU|nr:hypothetical protein D9Q98_006436 [Chlorella vulgaris]
MALLAAVSAAGLHPGPLLGAWQQQQQPGGGSQRNVAAHAKRRGPPKRNGSSAGGGGRGRSAPKDGTAVKDPPPRARQGYPRRRDGGGGNSSGGGGSAGFGSPGSRPLRREDNGTDVEGDGDADWSAELLADLSESEVAELIGEDGSDADVLAGADAELRAAVEAVTSQFAFQLDAFQVKAVAHLLDGKSVLVCAPTGAGKTAIAEAATLHMLARGRRVIYTTPLKALSNQKLGEMRERFGVDSAGLQTGDASLNIEAPVVVMTTEILRNMLYRVDEEGRTARDGLQDVGLVVLDEVHYLGDPGRGSVWEEVIINLPPHIQLLGMSATVRNPEDLGGWITQVHGECETIRTLFRPVPLTWHFCHSTAPPSDDSSRPPAPARLLPLLNEGGRKINPALLPPRARFALDDEGEAWGRWDGASRGKQTMRTVEELSRVVEEDEWHDLPRWKRIPSLEAVTVSLAERGMLPAIWFIFSRRECDLAARHLQVHGSSLTTPAEREQIQQELDALAVDQPEAVKAGFTEALLRGVASHHAGCLPAWKSLVERLFQRGLLKLVFATETLAAGINMPARTTLIAALSRRRDSGIGSLYHNELLQMAGRAGRRGYDTVGNCVILQSKWEDPDAAWDIIRKGPEPLRSQFSTGYSMVLNLLYTRSLAEARAFLDRSFSRYLGSIGSQRRLEEAAKLEERAGGIMEEVARRAGVSADAEALWTTYQKLQGRLKEEKRAAKLLRAQLADERAVAAEQALLRLTLPRLVGLDLSGSNLNDSDYRLPAMLLCDLERGSTGVWVVESEPDYLCLGADNKLYQVSARHISGISEASEPHPVADDSEAFDSIMHHARALRSRNWTELSGDVGCADGSVVTAMLALRLRIPAPGSTSPDPDLVPLLPTPEGLEALDLMRRRVRAVKAQVNEIKVDRGFMRAAKALNTQAAKAAALMERAAMLRGEVESQTGGNWRAFEDLLAILQEAGALEGVQESEEHQKQVEQQRQLAAGLEGSSGEGTELSSSSLRSSSLSSSSISSGSGEKSSLAADSGVEGTAVSSEAAASATTDSGGGGSGGDSGGSGNGGPGHVMFTPLGRVAREINCANEMWMALVLTHSAVQALPPPQLAGVLCAVISAECVSRPSVWTAYSATEAVTAAVLELEGVRGGLEALQARHNVVAPISVDLRLAGLVEAWAAGCSWEELMKDCSLDDGDVARLLTRTVDLLRQVAFCDTLLPALRKSARQAKAAMVRKPISDLIA